MTSSNLDQMYIISSASASSGQVQYICTFHCMVCPKSVRLEIVQSTFSNNCGSPLASNQALPSHMRNIISACKEGESLADFDHMLDVVGPSYQLAVNFAHTVTTHGRQRLDQYTKSASCKLQCILVSLWRFEQSRNLTRLCQLSHN